MAKNNRLMALAEALKGYDKALDIGCDHGYVLKYALDHGYIQSGIASDIADMPLALAKENLKGYPVTCVLSDGFTSINKTFDVALIAGMGAYTISHILDGAPSFSFDLILMPHDHTDDLRLYLSENGYQIVKEEMIQGKRFYPLLHVKRGIMNLTEKERYTGVNVIASEAAKAFYYEQYEKYFTYSKKATGKHIQVLQRQSKYFKEMYEEMSVKLQTKKEQT